MATELTTIGLLIRQRLPDGSYCYLVHSRGAPVLVAPVEGFGDEFADDIKQIEDDQKTQVLGVLVVQPE